MVARSESILQTIREVLRTEAEALTALAGRADELFVRAVEKILASPGKVVCTGIGKSGHIARKVSATLSSTGTLAVFLHPSEGIHGDLGMVKAGDVVLAFGKSGESEEILALLPPLRKIGASVVALTSNPDSTLAKNADLSLVVSVDREACPLDLAPTTSSTLFLAVGDALAVALMKARGFRPEDFALYHPGGRLGKRLLLKVEDLMVPLAECPALDIDEATIQDVVAALGGFGIVLFRTAEGRLEGILTDGDIRRAMNKHREGIFTKTVRELANLSPVSIRPDVGAVEALSLMENRPRPLNVLPVTRADGQIVGLVRLHELLKLA